MGYIGVSECVGQMTQICYGHFLAIPCRQNNVGGSVAWTSLKQHVEFVRERGKRKKNKRKRKKELRKWTLYQKKRKLKKKLYSDIQ